MAVSGQFDRPADLDRGNFGTPFSGSGQGGPGTGGVNARKGCQIFVRNVSNLILYSCICIFFFSLIHNVIVCFCSCPLTSLGRCWRTLSIHVVRHFPIRLVFWHFLLHFVNRYACFLTGIVQYADIKMENGKSKGCGVVRFDSPETAERACRTMNGYRLSGREIDVRIDRNA